MKIALAILCLLSFVPTVYAESKFEYTISNDNLDVAESGSAMGFTGVGRKNQPCMISIVLGNPKLAPSKLNMEFKFSDIAGLQSGEYKVNPDAQVGSSWFEKNQQQVSAVFFPTGKQKKTYKRMQGLDGVLTIQRDGLNVTGEFQGTFAEFGSTAFGKRKVSNEAKVTAQFKHVLVESHKDFSNAYLCK